MMTNQILTIAYNSVIFIAMTAERPGLLEGRQVLVMGLLDTKSYAWAIGERVRQEGAQVVYTV